MAQFFTDFSEYELGVEPHDWAKFGSRDKVTYRVVSAPAYTGGVALRADITPNGFFPAPLAWLSVPAATVQEVVVRGTRIGSTGSSWGSGRSMGLCLRWDTTDLGGGYGAKLSNGVSSSLLGWWKSSPNTEADGNLGVSAPITFPMLQGELYCIRIRIGADWKLQAKAWPDAQPEPETWNWEYTIPEANRFFSSGVAGLFVYSDFSNEAFLIDVFGYGTDGDPAPLEPPGPPGDVTITPPIIDASATALAPAIIVPRSAMISVPVIGASAAALAPSAQTGRRADGAAPLAGVSALALAPVVTAVRRVDVEVPAVYAVALAFAPTVTTERAATVRPPLVDASASGLPPIVSTGRFVAVSVPLMQASADALAPDVAAERHVMVRAEIAEAVAQALAPTVDVAGAVTIRPPAASAAAEIMRPAVTAVRQVAVSVPLVEAVAEAFPPAVHTGTAAKIDIPVIDVLAETLAPAVSTRRDVRVLVPAIAAAAEVLPPIVDVERAIYLEIGIKLISDGRYQAGISPSRTSLVVLE